MSPITHLLFVVIRYCKQIWFQRQSGALHWWGMEMEFAPVRTFASFIIPEKCLSPRRKERWEYSKMGSQIGTDAHLLSLWIYLIFFPCLHEFQPGLWCSWGLISEEWQRFGCDRAFLPILLFALNEAVLCFIPCESDSHSLFLSACQNYSCKNTHRRLYVTHANPICTSS